MSYGFQQIPVQNFSPGFHAELAFRRAGLGAAPRDALIVGYLRDGDTDHDLEPIVVLGESDARIPRKSQLAEMIRSFRRVNLTSRITAIGLTPPSAGTAAAGTLTVTGTATASGTIVVYVAGKRIEVGVTSGDTADDVAAAIEAAIDADPDVPMTSAVGADPNEHVVTVTANFKGVEGNRLRLAVDPLDTDLGVAGISIAVVQPTGGAGTPDLDDAIALVTSERFYSVIVGFSDATSIGALVDEMVRREDAMVALDGKGFVGIRGTFAEQITEADAYNSPLVVILGAGPSVTPPWVLACLAAGWDSRKPHPVQGYLNLPLPGFLAPFSLADRPDKAERDLSLAAGVSTWRVNGSQVVLDQLVTTRTEDDSANPDTSRLLLTLGRTAEALRFSWVASLQKFANFVLADAPDLATPPPGAPILTPSSLRSHAIDWFIQVRDGLGLVQDLEAFKAELDARVNELDPNRLDAFLPPRVTRQLVTIASLIQIR